MIVHRRQPWLHNDLRQLLSSFETLKKAAELLTGATCLLLLQQLPTGQPCWPLPLNSNCCYCFEGCLLESSCVSSVVVQAALVSDLLCCCAAVLLLLLAKESAAVQRALRKVHPQSIADIATLAVCVELGVAQGCVCMTVNMNMIESGVR